MSSRGRWGALLALALVGCGSGSPTFASCVDDVDCADPADACYRLRFTRSDGSAADGTLCTRECVSDADCGPDALCIGLDGDPSGAFFCAARCEASGDCFADFVCTPLDGTTGAACLP